LVQAANLGGFMFIGQSSFNSNSSFIENITATAVLGHSGPFTGTLSLTWSGNSTVQARAATGTITLNGDVASVPEPSSALLLSVPVALFFVVRRREWGMGLASRTGQ
jgi:hypothetical protein